MEYISPKLNLETFTCPHCGALTQQNRLILNSSKTWIHGYQNQITGYNSYIHLAYCQVCKAFSVWLRDNMIYPDSSNVDLPNQDLSEDIKEDYLEARSIVVKSPRGACAILRLALQKLMVQIGEKGKDINADIASLVKKGLSPKIQQTLDIVRVIGNEAVHPGTIDLRDDSETANKIFGLINVIAYYFITHPKEIEDLYGDLPVDKIEGIIKRDSS